MSQLEPLRRGADGDAAKGWDSFLCEQRMDSIWRSLFTMGTAGTSKAERVPPFLGGTALAGDLKHLQA